MSWGGVHDGARTDGDGVHGGKVEFVAVRDEGAEVEPEEAPLSEGGRPGAVRRRSQDSTVGLCTQRSKRTSSRGTVESPTRARSASTLTLRVDVEQKSLRDCPETSSTLFSRRGGG